jgi:pheromone a factor receptor
MGPPTIDASLPQNRYIWPLPDTTFHYNVPAQIAARLVFGLVASLALLIPLKLLHRNAELAAVTLLAATLARNVLTMLNAVVWRSDAGLARQFDGHVYCDVQVYLAVPLQLVYATAILAVMSNLARQMRLAGGRGAGVMMTRREKRRRNWRAVAIIFPPALVQMAAMYPLGWRRYLIHTVVGCKWAAYRTWVSVVFFYVPHPVVASASCYYAGESPSAQL